MLAGQCPAGKELFRKALEVSRGATRGPAQLDQETDDNVTQVLPGHVDEPARSVPPGRRRSRRRRLQGAEGRRLLHGRVQTRPSGSSGSVKPKDEDDPVKFVFRQRPHHRPEVPWRAAHDCAAALTVYKEAWKLDR